MKDERAGNTPRGGLEPPTFRLTAERSAIELAGIITAIILAYAKRFVKKKSGFSI